MLHRYEEVSDDEYGNESYYHVFCVLGVVVYRLLFIVLR
jgi:hypothetical protein